MLMATLRGRITGAKHGLTSEQTLEGDGAGAAFLTTPPGLGTRAGLKG